MYWGLFRLVRHDIKDFYKGQETDGTYRYSRQRERVTSQAVQQCALTADAMQLGEDACQYVIAVVRVYYRASIAEECLLVVAS